MQMQKKTGENGPISISHQRNTLSLNEVIHIFIMKVLLHLTLLALSISYLT